MATTALDHTSFVCDLRLRTPGAQLFRHVPDLSKRHNRGTHRGWIGLNTRRAHAHSWPLGAYVHRKTFAYLVAQTLHEALGNTASDQHRVRIDDIKDIQQGEIAVVGNRFDPLVDDGLSVPVQLIKGVQSRGGMALPMESAKQILRQCGVT